MAYGSTSLKSEISAKDRGGGEGKVFGGNDQSLEAYSPIQPLKLHGVGNPTSI